ncbi:MAG TPA: YciI family protein [Devosia sp.]|nr:YciI family protein [Devosia sp.]
MRYMVIVKSTPDGYDVPPTREMFEAMDRYNQSLRDAGVLLALDGLAGPREGARITFSNGKPHVTDGPFAEAKELVAGFWILQVRDKEEAIEWAKRIPFSNGESVEIRRVSEASDFADVMSPEAIAREDAMRAELSRKSN